MAKRKNPWDELAEKPFAEIKAYIEQLDAAETGIDAHFGDDAAGNKIILRLLERFAGM